ncbi:FAD binding domain protein [Aspergillus alliaceus]|uniref:FAD binding domain protein n=1 Tax=Petromyces alliaceus TaxID=209559 RepID=UPI0012A6B557|nr:FAD binding domain protein [Aspergillus alliaceus]KAB8236625.1 FAD binding domain protein [Aspergillus alliaceus]
MDRATTPFHHLVVLLLPLLGVVASAATCRCFPDEACWPSPLEWSEFNATVGGNLIATVPIGSVCHTNNTYAAYDAKACTDLISNWGDPARHYESSSSPMAAWFTNFSCSPFGPFNSPCAIGPLVRYAVNVTSTADVQKTLNFIREHNIRLVIRNTGHDYMGKSTGAGAVAIWVHHLKKIEHVQYFSDRYTGPALRMGAGVQGFEATAAAQAQGQLLVSGNCPSVGLAGGYTQGGGHGQLVSQFGLAADQVLEWEVMTAGGELLTASPSQHADLFWALSGGGGGTYAIVLGVVVKVYPEMKTATATLSFTDSRVTPEGYWEIIRGFLVDTLALVDVGGVVVWTIAATGFSVTPVTLPGGSQAQLHSYLTPTLTRLKQYNMTYQYEITEFSTFYDSYQATNPSMNITEFQIGSHLIPRSTVETNSTAVISALIDILHEGVTISGISLNVSRTAWPDNAVNPTWRDTAMSIVLGTPFNYTDRGVNEDRQALMTNVLIPRLKAISPDGGAYLNEADWKQPDWPSAFYGEHYERLLAIKDKYDVDQVLYGRTAVGSERWSEQDDGHLCRAT